LTSIEDGIDVSVDRSGANRTYVRHNKRGLGTGAFFGDSPHDLRYDLAGLLDDYLIADPDVFPLDLVSVVQSSTVYGSTREMYGREPGDRREYTGSADLYFDSFQNGFGLVWRKLIRYSPSGRFSGRAKRGLLRYFVDFDNHTVDLERILVASLLYSMTTFEHLLDRATQFMYRIDGEPESRHHVESVNMGRYVGAFNIPDLVGYHSETASGGLSAIEQFKRPSGGVSGVGEQRFSPLGSILIDRRKHFFRQIDLSPNF